MILDARTIEAGDLAAAICIVGAGPVGITLALELGRAGLDVILLEAGSERPTITERDSYRGIVVDPRRHGPLEESRARGLGGTSRIWAGRSAPFDPIDFEARPWIADSGWPIDATTLAPHYARASKLCETGAFAYTVDEALGCGRPMIEGFDGGAFSTDRIERFSCPTDFGARYRARLQAMTNVRVIGGAPVVQILLDADGHRATALDVRTSAGRRILVSAGEIVLAAGGLEIPRLLLASTGVQAAGIGNAHDVVGRFYMSHVAGTIGRFTPREGTRAVSNGYERAADGTFCRRRLTLRPEVQRSHRIGNFVARLHHARVADPAHGSGILSALWLGQYAIPRQFRSRLTGGDVSLRDRLRHMGNVARDTPRVATFMRRMLVSRAMAARKYPSVIVAPRDAAYALDFHAEQQPDFSSRVRLSADRDMLGMPRLEVDWRYGAGDVTTITTALHLFAEDVARSDAGSFSFSVEDVEPEILRYGAYPGHHIGTTRMGADPRRSVVDADGTVHGMHNLHIAGSAVFPTSSQANPTLTAVALAVRLAGHLVARAQRRPLVLAS